MKTIPWAASAAVALLAGAASWAPAQEKPTGPQSIEGPAGAIYVDDGGGVTGTPVVFLHSFAGDSSHWASTMSALRHERRALAIDLRGHGKSARPRDGDYTVASMVKDVAAVADALKLKRFVLVGHSMGGVVAAAYAAEHPRRVAGLVLVGTPGRMPPEDARRTLAAIESDYAATMAGYWAKLLDGAQPHVRTQIAAQREAMPREAAVPLVHALFASDTPRALDRYRGAKLIVPTGLDDVPHALHRQRPTLPVKRIEDASHWPHLDQPKEFTRIIESFVASL